MTVEEIRQLIISRAVTYSKEYSVSIFKAITDYAHSLYHFSTARGLHTLYSSGYRERFYDFVLGDDKALNTSELRFAATYFTGSKKGEEYGAELLEELQLAVSEHRAEVKRLTDSTEGIRRDQESLYPSKILSRISDYIQYVKETMDEPSNGILLYTSLYHIGYIDGIRAERTRRKAKKVPTREEASCNEQATA